MSIADKTGKLVLGTAQLGLKYGISNRSGKPAESEAILILTAAQKAGITQLDTANAYGDAIDIIGRFHRSNPPFGIINKFRSGDLSLKKHTIDLLKRMAIPFFDADLFHSFNDFETKNFSHRELRHLKERDLIKKIGLSIYTNEQFETAIRSDLIEVIQFPYNLLDNSNQRLPWIIKAKEAGKELHARSIFLQGLFFLADELFPPKLRPLIPYLNDLKKIASNLDMSLGKLAINYVLDTEFIDKVVVGVDDIRQLNQILEWIRPDSHRDIAVEADKIKVGEVDLLNPVNWK
jgi:aryl-alcohol dehydrogenase-like predicted oxidoreductase